jgi:hypothetical protein
MRKIMLIAMFVLSLFIMSNCDKEVEIEGRDEHWQGDKHSEQNEDRNLRDFRAEGHEGQHEELRR